MNRNDLFKELYRRCNGYIELRALPSKPIIRTFVSLGTDWLAIKKQIDGFCQDNKELNIYFGVATRDGKRGKKENVVSIPCVWADIDFKDTPEDKFNKKLKAFPFKPTIIIRSGNGLHLYFLLNLPVEQKYGSKIERINQWIEAELSGDNVDNIDRILRVPGTVNHKYDHKPLCEVVEINDYVYKLDDFLEKIPEPATKLPTGNDDILERAEQSNSKVDTELVTQVENVVKQIEEKDIILGDDSYNDWLRIGFALADGLEEEGRKYFHKVSSVSGKYNKDDCDKQYDYCLNGNEPEEKITISTFFYYAKEAGLETTIPKTVNVTDVTVVTDDLEECINQQIPIYSFPFDVFPNEFQEVIKKEGIFLSVEPEIVANTKITILSGAIGNSIRISPKPDFKVSPFIWSGLVAPTGYGKSPAINASMDHIEDLQAESYRKYQDELNKYKLQRSQVNKGKKTFLSDVLMSPPVFKQLKVSDTTVEALADVFEYQPRGVILHRDELSGLILSLNQYKDSKGSDKQHYLELFDAKPMMINRKTSEPKYVPNTGSAIIGGISPRVLPKIFNTDSFFDGFLPRFLFLLIEYKSIKYCRDSLNSEDLSYWKRLVDFCYYIPLDLDENNRVKPNILTLDNSALDLWESFNNEYNQIIGFLPERIRGFIPKLITYSLKFAGILQILKNFKNGKIDKVIDIETVNNAIKLTRFYAGQAVLMIKLYDIPVVELNGYQKRIVHVLYNLQHKVVGGELLLSEIVNAYNDSLNDGLKLKPEKISNILNKELRLTTKKRGANLSHLIWEQEKIQKLFKQTVTSVTSVKTPELNDEEKWQI